MQVRSSLPHCVVKAGLMLMPPQPECSPKVKRRRRKNVPGECQLGQPQRGFTYLCRRPWPRRQKIKQTKQKTKNTTGHQKGQKKELCSSQSSLEPCAVLFTYIVCESRKQRAAQVPRSRSIKMAKTLLHGDPGALPHRRQIP